MEAETKVIKTPYIRSYRAIDPSPITFDLPALVENMKDSSVWESGELHTMILLNSEAKKIMLTVMHDQTEVRSYQSGDSVTLQMIEGRMKFETPKKNLILIKGQLITIHDKTKFTLTTLEESAFLLTILTGSMKLH